MDGMDAARKSQKKPRGGPPPAAPVRTHVVLVTGLSGAGKSTVLRAFEDMGYEAVDNLPLALLPNLVGIADDNPEHVPAHAVAVGIDTRTRAFRPDRFDAELARLRKRRDLNLTLVFLDCSSDVLARRFTETRRRHPLAVDRPVIDGIARERTAMETVRAHADYVFDSTDLTARDLKRIVARTFAAPEDGRMTVSVSSFAFPQGLPRDADLVFDVRFLKNPHYVAHLSPLTGKNAEVALYIEADPAYHLFLQKLEDLLTSLLPLYQREGKAYLTIAFGCTGGRHRSVMVAERIGELLRAQGMRVNVLHRELDRLREPGRVAPGDNL